MPVFPRSLLGGLACALALAGGVALMTLAADPRPATPDPQARRLLDEVAKAYRGLSAYADHGEFKMALSINGKAQKQSSPIRLTLARPNKMDLDAGPVRMVSDGTTLTTAIAPFKKYTASPAPKTITLDTLREGPLGAALFGGPLGGPMIALVNLLTADDAAKAILSEFDGTLKSEPNALLIDRAEGPDYRLRVDPATKLLTAIDLVIDPKDLEKNTAPGQKIAIEQLGWSAGSVSTEAPRADAFAYQPPKEFSKVESFRQQGADEASKDAVSELLGKPAPDFTLTVLDGAGKTRTLSKADLAGKVVLIDFWATWCGPCLRELPEIQKLVEAYAGKDVVIVALSQDSKPQDLAEVRKLVETTLEKKKITLTDNPVGKVGLDPSNSVGDVFKVQAYPTVVLLDAQGVVQAAHVGPPSNDFKQVVPVLSKSIDSLLAGKSLLTPKAEKAAKVKD
ncbi:MAG: TlpA family protein disulfide reductase [Planctomycetaceae bacterium]|nr:TlpA family protein disulfide reductase [Planctomycetaceae bacterium]